MLDAVAPPEMQHEADAKCGVVFLRRESIIGQPEFEAMHFEGVFYVVNGQALHVFLAWTGSALATMLCAGYCDF